MDYKAEISDILSRTARGNGLCWYLFNYLLKIPYEERAGLLHHLILTYYTGHSSKEVNMADPFGEDAIERFKRQEMLYHREVNQLVFQNLPAEEFYRMLNEYIFGKEHEPGEGRFWKFYTCITNLLLPYYRVELEKAYPVDTEEYKACKAGLEDEFIMPIDSIIIEQVYDTNFRKAQGVLEIVEKGKTSLERVILMEEAIMLMLYTSQHYEDLIAYRNGEKDLYIYFEDVLTYSFSRDWGERRYKLEARSDLMSVKEYYMRSRELGPEKCLQAERIMHYVESNKYDTYVSIAQIMLAFLEKEPVFENRVTLLANAFEYCELLRE